MKTSYKIILGGLVFFISGIILLLFSVYGDSYYEIEGFEATISMIGLISTGLIIIGIGIMLEFIRRKYEIRK